MGPRLGRRGAEVKCGLRAACCRFDEASLLAVGVWERGLFESERRIPPGSRLPDAKAAAGFRSPSWVRRLR